MALLQKFHPKEVTWVLSLDETVDYVREACILGTPVTIPRPRSRERIFLHVYSGRRRPGDFQFYPEHFFAQDAEGLVLHVVSLDIVIDETWGDVRNPRKTSGSVTLEKVEYMQRCVDHPARLGAKPDLSDAHRKDLVHCELYWTYGDSSPWH